LRSWQNLDHRFRGPRLFEDPGFGGRKIRRETCQRLHLQSSSSRPLFAGRALSLAYLTDLSMAASTEGQRRHQTGQLLRASKVLEDCHSVMKGSASEDQHLEYI